MKKSVTRPFSKGISFLFLLGSFASTIHAATLTANYDSFFKAPACLGSGSGCQTNAVNGRAAITNGPESGAPNTVFSQCADGVSGYYHSDESIDSLSIISNDGTNLAVGKIVTVTANVWAYGPSGDTLDVFYATNANSPVWTLKGSVAATKAGAQNLSVSFPLQAGATQAVRASFRYLGSATPCTMGGYDDHDDMVFAVTGSSATTPPTVVVSTPVQNGSYGAVVSFNGTASASAGFKSIQVGIDTTPDIYLTASTIWSYLLDTNYMT